MKRSCLKLVLLIIALSYISVSACTFGKERVTNGGQSEETRSLLDETIVRTKQNRGKNQALAFEELEGEEGQAESESGDGYKSALKRSTGWDGKPIPYWFDKLGLGQEYKCEICREYSYPGKRAFERHFNELLHRCRLEAGGNLGKGTEGNSSNQAPAGVAIPPPDIRIVMEKQGWRLRGRSQTCIAR